jgi:DNA-binding NarL/FixJ family response regulator
MAGNIRIVLADDHPVMRSGIRTLMEVEADFNVVGEAANGLEALRLVELLKPDVLLLDMEMPGLSGVEVARRIRDQGLPVYVLALSAYDDRAYITGLLESGASGYITKEKPPQMIVEAVRAVARGEGRWFIQPVQRDALPVTDREQAVLRLMARGMTNQEIAAQLYISENTVRNHIGRIYRRLGVKSWREAVAWAWQHGLMGPEPE